MTIITKDRDFADAARFPGPPPRVVRLRILNDRTAATELYLREHAAEIEQFSTSNERYLEV
jgi:predicted nuclease of predicted toxin-antitoxin system